MNWLKDYRVWVVALILVSAFLDIATTFRARVLETNPAYFVLGSNIYALFLVKLVGCGFFAYNYWRAEHLQEDKRFIWSNGVVVLIAVQFIAAWHNAGVYADLGGAVPQGPTNIAEQVAQIKHYFEFTQTFFIYPWIVSLASYGLFKLSKPKKEVVSR